MAEIDKKGGESDLRKKRSSEAASGRLARSFEIPLAVFKPYFCTSY
jgi:hypothetical protein